MFKKPDDRILELIVRTGDTDINKSLAALRDLAAKAITEPLRQGVLVGDNVRSVFSGMVLAPGATPEWSLDLLQPGEEDLHVAYTNPGNGRIAERHVEGDYVMVPTYGITSAIDWLLRFARDARYDVVGRALQILDASFIKKVNDDGWHTLLSAAVDRNILVYDADASAGQFTKRLISLMKTVMRRNAGGNTGSLRRGLLTDLFLSPEAIEDIRNWGVDQIDEVTRREIFLASDGSPVVKRLYDVNLHDLDEFGQNQEYQLFFENDLGASVQTSDVEMVLGVDMSADDSFVMPIRQEVQIFEDPALHRHQRAGYYGWMELGFAVLDNRRVLLGSF